MSEGPAPYDDVASMVDYLTTANLDGASRAYRDIYADAFSLISERYPALDREAALQLLAIAVANMLTDE